MSIIFNGTTLSASAVIEYLCTTLKDIVFDGVNVWKKSGVVFKAESQELTSKKTGSIFPYSTITQDADFFSRSSENVVCQKAGTYTISATVKTTYGNDFHATVYKGNSELFTARGNETKTNSISFAKGEYVRCNSSASGQQNGYVTLTISN